MTKTTVWVILSAFCTHCMACLGIDTLASLIGCANSWSCCCAVLCCAACVGNPTAPNANFSCNSSTPVGGACSATCASGYSGNVTSVCLPDQTWQLPSGRYLLSTLCSTSPPQSTRLNATFTCGRVRLNERCYGRCARNATARPYVVCRAGGRWSSAIGSCT